MHKFKFSVIIPIYNVEDYIEETISSVINQTIGFEENIQMILVNDGSPDNSEAICKKYKELYPNNITYIKQENAGVSAARNHGLEYVEGEYVNFLDSDDKWELDAFEKVYKFFKENKNIDVVATMLEFFEARTGLGHPLNKKFNKDKLIDIRYDYDLIQMHMASCFIRAKAIDIKFSTELKYAEDSLFINQIIFKKQEYGVMKSVHYLYRKRANETSAIDTCQINPEFYNKTLNNFHLKMIECSLKQYGTVPLYVQFMLMYDLQWRIKRPLPKDILSEQEMSLYVFKLKEILRQIEDVIILSQKDIALEHKIFALQQKHNKDVRYELKQIKKEFYFNNLKIFSANNKNLLKIGYINIKNNVLHMEGLINTSLPKDTYKIFIEDKNQHTYDLNIVQYTKREKNTLLGHYYYERWFTVDIPLENVTPRQFKFKLQYKENAPLILDIGTTDTCNLNTSLQSGFLKLDENIVEYKKYKIIVRNKSRKLHLKKELRFESDLFKKKIKNITKNVIIYRFLMFLCYYSPLKKDIWIISDRPDAARDNGEAFFKYMQTQKNDNRKVYFAINKNTDDYHRMKKIGKVIPMNSFKYKLLFLMSSKIISSQASDYIINPFGKNKRYIKDLYKFDFVFLQHGIIKDDLSSWLNKANKNMQMFVTSGHTEYQSVAEGEYYYGPDIVKLTGLPRHDYLLKNNTKTKNIVIIPTWRQSIPNCTDNQDRSIYNPDFDKTEFFKFYNKLINDERLCRTMKEYGYNGLFCLHPLFKAQSPHFKENDTFKIEKGDMDYQKVFSTYDMLITDYSSVFFDFAYLYKPTLYCQFDKEEFFNSHSYDQGYFDYEKDGFGKVCYDLETTIDNIIKEIENDCIINKKYENRIDKFYPSKRGNNCQNIYNEILKL